jgi:hypothetical protein
VGAKKLSVEAHNLSQLQKEKDIMTTSTSTNTITITLTLTGNLWDNLSLQGWFRPSGGNKLSYSEIESYEGLIHAWSGRGYSNDWADGASAFIVKGGERIPISIVPLRGNNRKGEFLVELPSDPAYTF